MIASKYKWNVKKLQINPQVKAIASELKLTPLLVAILWQRGLQSSEKIERFLNPNPENLRDPYLMHDMKKGIQRITNAIEADEKITIYGDYDADGITSTAILYETLLELGANVDYYIPNRFTDGYGPNVNAFTKLIKNGTKLIITVDNGVTGVDAVNAANNLGCDVIISDHHDLPPKLPDAYAIIHARYPGDEYPFGDFSGAGIAFKISTALTEEIPQEVLDLATIGTVADVVSLTDENRIIVKFGFKALELTQRPGLAALIKNAGLDEKTIDEHKIGFQIAPRLNALGRMGDANVGVELLTTIDPERGQELADLTDNKNKERQKLVRDITKQAFEQADNVKNRARKTLVIIGNGWHEGVLGIVASRLVDKYHKPTLVLTKKDNGELKGSGRSIDGFNLFASLDGYRDQMIKFGGHEMAVGLTVSADKLVGLTETLEKYYLAHYSSKHEKPVLDVDCRINVNQINMNLYQDLQQMAPFGTDNQEPVFEIMPDSIDHFISMGKNNEHLKFMANEDNAHLMVIDFRCPDLKQKLENFSGKISLTGTIDLNEWHGQSSLQFMLTDLAGYGMEIIDRRCNMLTKEMFQEPNNYLFFNSKVAKQVKPFINSASKVMIANETFTDELDELVIVDFPNKIDDLKRIVLKLKPKKLILYLYHKRSKIVIPNRMKFAKLYQFLTEHNNFNLRKGFKLLQKNLKIPQDLIVFMLQVFNELEFIKINDGVVKTVDQPNKHDLKSASSYQMREQRLMTAQELLSSQEKLFGFIQNFLKG